LKKTLLLSVFAALLASGVASGRQTIEGIQRGVGRKLAVWCALELRAGNACPKDATSVPLPNHLFIEPYVRTSWRFSCVPDACTAFTLGGDLSSPEDNFSSTVGKDEVHPYPDEKKTDCSEFSNHK
jgi:hypothetical protein